jgi:hypothetical protein
MIPPLSAPDPPTADWVRANFPLSPPSWHFDVEQFSCALLNENKGGRREEENDSDSYSLNDKSSDK